MEITKQMREENAREQQAQQYCQDVRHTVAGHPTFATCPVMLSTTLAAMIANNYDAPVVSLSHEHGLIGVDAATFRQVGIGDVLLIFPVRSCPTYNFYFP